MDFLRISKEEKLCKQTVKASLLDVEQLVCMRRSRLVAEEVIDEKGLFNEARGKEICETLQIPTPTPYQKRFFYHIRHVLDLFIESSHAKLRLKQLSFPLASPFIEQLISRSLGKGREIEKRDISLALLVAVMAPLRQSVGSCFATAPLMIVQHEQPFFLFEELYNLVTRGFLKRVVNGKEVRIPVSIKTGMGDLLTPMHKDSIEDPSLKEALGMDHLPLPNPQDTINSYIERVSDDPKHAKELFKAKTQSLLLKSYEFTVASLSDWKTDFSSWNMYTSLGLDHNEPGGIGQALYQFLEKELGKVNEDIDKLTDEVHQTEGEIRALETLLRNSTNPDQIRRLKGEIQAKAHHMYVSEDLHYHKRERSKKIAEFYKFIVEQLMRLFPEYFQELFDAEMVSSGGDILEDRPAGFRLLYKHGRYDPSVWTMIYNEDQYTQMLSEFFKAIERILFMAVDWEEGKDLIETMIDGLVHSVREPEFIELAHKRMAKMHLHTLKESAPRTPWAYESGGSVDTLIQAYFRMVNQPKKVIFKPERPVDLLTELIEWMKDAPYAQTNRFTNDSAYGLLMTSPVHAFVFTPGVEGFVKAWENSYNTYTFVRDQVIERGRAAYHEAPLTHDEIKQICQLLAPFGLPNTPHFDEIVDSAEKHPVAQTILAEMVVNLTYRKGVLVHIPFADTNWASDNFTFLVNPVNKEVELWRCNDTLFRALPSWESHFQGKEWTIYPEERRG